jgi:hypothetical protein
MAAGPNRRGDRESDDPFQPRMGRRQRPDHERVPTFGAQLAQLIAKRGGRKRGIGRAASMRGRVAVRAPHALSRRCVIKARYVAMTGNGSKIAKAHLAYLERDGVERDGSPGRLYGPDEKFDAAAFRAPVDGEPRQFRFIVSPEDADRLDLSEFTRQLMKQVEQDTGRRLEWAAVNHHNTDNPHVHIVVRGLDRDGDEVRIDGRNAAHADRGNSSVSQKGRHLVSPAQAFLLVAAVSRLRAKSESRVAAYGFRVSASVTYDVAAFCQAGPRSARSSRGEFCKTIGVMRIAL